MSSLYCCNACGHIPDVDGPRAYFMSSCGHVLCEQCSRQGGVTCPACESKCRFAEVTNDPRPEITVYFKDTIDTLKQIIKVSQFQNVQALRYKSQIRKLADQQRVLQRENDALMNDNVSLKRKIDTLEQRDQAWIGNGVLASPHGGGDGFFVAAPPMTFVSQRQPGAVALPPVQISAPSPFFNPAPTVRQPTPTSASAFGSSMTGGNSAGHESHAASRLTRRHTPTLQAMQSQRLNAMVANGNATNRPLHHRTAIPAVGPSRLSRDYLASNRLSVSRHTAPYPPPTTSSTTSSAAHSALMARLRQLSCSSHRKR